MVALVALELPATGADKWVSLILAAAALIVQGLWTLAVFMWSRGSTTEKLAGKVAALGDEVARMKSQQDRATARGSENEGRNITTFGKFQVDLAVLGERMEQSERDRNDIWQVLNRRRNPRD